MSEAEDPYGRWADHHAALFGFGSDADLRMVAEWSVLFAQQGYTPAELTEATDWLAVNEPPRYRADHLDALVRRLRQQRNPPAPPPPEEDPRGTCAECGGTGRVVVPRHPMPPERWYTWTVLCCCPLGRWFGGRQAGLAPMTLDAYQALNPGWRAQLRLHEQTLRAGVRATALDRVLGALGRMPREGGDGVRR